MNMISKHLRKIVLAAAAIAALAGGALALNQDQTRNFPARQGSTQQVNYWRVTINFNDPNISTAQKFGAVPQGSFIENVECEVVTAFNAGTTNNLTLGTTSPNANEIMAATDLPGGGGASISTGVTRVTRGFGRGLTASGDTTLFAKYTQTGGAATTGQAVCVIGFIPNNDL